MIRVGLTVQGSIERYDAEGRLVASQPLQPVQVAGMTAAALAQALAQLGEQLAAAWAETTPTEGAEG